MFAVVVSGDVQLRLYLHKYFKLLEDYFATVITRANAAVFVVG